MVTETVKFDHSAGSFHSVFGLSKSRAMEITGSILFTEIDKAFVVHELFNNADEAPAEFTTQTGVLDAVLGDVNNDNEALYATYEWSKHVTLSNTQEDYKKMIEMFAILYKLNEGDRDKFITAFVDRVEEAGE